MVLVTGGVRGVGAGISAVFADQGATVVTCARRPVDGSPYEFHSCDIRDDDSVKALIGAIVEKHGRLDVVVNNAGVSNDGVSLDLPTAKFDELMAINVRGVWLVAVRAARRWKQAARGGSIVNIASIQGERVMSGITPYSSSKAAVVHMTKSLALEWARYGIRVNAIEPGYIGTEMTDAMWETDYGKALIKRIPMRRLGKTEELNGLFLLFATDAGSWMTGACVPVDGGHLCSSL